MVAWMTGIDRSRSLRGTGMGTKEAEELLRIRLMEARLKELQKMRVDKMVNVSV